MSLARPPDERPAPAWAEQGRRPKGAPVTALALRLRATREHTAQLLPGLLAAGVTASAAAFLGEHYAAPVMLFALLLGLAMNFLASEGACQPGIDFAARTVLRLGVALLGLRITVAQVAALGWGPVVSVVVAVALTIAVAMLAARLVGFQSLFGLLSGGATAICGASAALALAAALPAHPQKDKATSFTVIIVSVLSTLAMVTYPMLAHWLGLSEAQAGQFLGGTIHDVAQVVGAGYGMSNETGDVATVVKLMRVAMLLPVIVFATLLTRSQANAGAPQVGLSPLGGGAGSVRPSGPANDAPGTTRPPLLPGFAVGFVALVGLGSTGWLPTAAAELGHQASRACLVMAIAAIGMKTQLKQLAAVGLKPVLLMLGETVFLAALVALQLRLAGSP